MVHKELRHPQLADNLPRRDFLYPSGIPVGCRKDSDRITHHLPEPGMLHYGVRVKEYLQLGLRELALANEHVPGRDFVPVSLPDYGKDRKSTRLNSSHGY